ncbi:hypothetical protein BH09ACT4_BH09ACT4_01420 [soil metagenome]
MLVYFLNHSTAAVNLGGAERSMIRLVEDWIAADQNFEPYFLTKSPAGLFVAELEKRHWPYEAIRFRGWAGPRSDPPASELAYFARTDYNAVRRMIAIMEARRPDLVVTNTLVAPWAAFAAKVLDIPHAWMVREYGDLDHGLVFTSGVESTLADIGLLSEAVVTNSFALRDRLARFVDPAKLSVTYPQVDADAIVVAADASPPIVPFPRGGELKITIVGRLTLAKGQWRVIEAVAELASRGVDAALCLVGSAIDRDYRRTLDELIRKLGIGARVTFVGESDNPFPYIAASDVCVTASDIEAFGRTTVEYLLLERAVVATRGGGSAELIEDGVTGTLVDAENPDAFAAALMVYAENPQLRSEHGRRGAVRIRNLLDQHDNRVAIARLTDAAARSTYRLPAIAKHWFALPELTHSTARTGDRVTASFLMVRLGAEAVRVVRRVRRTTR